VCNKQQQESRTTTLAMTTTSSGGNKIFIKNGSNIDKHIDASFYISNF